MAQGVQVTFDAADPRRLSEFWALALDYEVQSPAEGVESREAFGVGIGWPRVRWGAWSAVVDPSGKGPRVFFRRVPEVKRAKNRVHLDIDVSGHTTGTEGWRKVRDKADMLVAAGATVVCEVDEPLGRCLVMRDPEGNEFCLQ
ncbi:VOC family protein [Saccharomonospora sp.]|uniref:VOC family protein n=1 Tax=Saccharomonospora sp. TaxID=33913 RepID=UPI00262F82AA|nr:VOC family protein [Saccharomonospora sp.]